MEKSFENILDAFSGKPEEEKKKAAEKIMDNLGKDESDKIRSILSDSEKVREILSSQQAQNIIRKLRGS